MYCIYRTQVPGRINSHTHLVILVSQQIVLKAAVLVKLECLRSAGCRSEQQIAYNNLLFAQTLDLKWVKSLHFKITLYRPLLTVFMSTSLWLYIAEGSTPDRAGTSTLAMLPPPPNRNSAATGGQRLATKFLVVSVFDDHYCAFMSYCTASKCRLSASVPVVVLFIIVDLLPSQHQCLQ